MMLGWFRTRTPVTWLSIVLTVVGGLWPLRPAYAQQACLELFVASKPKVRSLVGSTHGQPESSLVGPFIAAYGEERPRWELIKTPSHPTIRSKDYWDFRKQPYLNLFIWRGRGDESGLPKTITPMMAVPGELQGHDRPLANVRGLIQNTLNGLYESFASQGPERQLLVPIVKDQDRKDLDRTTHFEIGNVSADGLLSEGAGHLQMMISRDANEPLHVEDQWGRLRRKPGEVIGELGRYYFSRGDEAIGKRALNESQKEILRLMLWQKMFAWANHDVKIDRTFFQVNDRVREILIERYGLPLEKARAREVYQTFDGKRVREWIFELDSNLMREAEKGMTARLIAKHLEDYLKEDASKSIREGSVIKMRFAPNEIPALRSLGLVDSHQARSGAAVELTYTTAQARVTLRSLTRAK